MTRAFACIVAGAFCVSMGCAQILGIEDLPEASDASPPGDSDAGLPDAGQPDAGQPDACPVDTDPPDAERCSGNRIRSIPLQTETATYGCLNVYYDDADGTNCAKTRAVGVARGNATWIEVELIRCTQTSPGDGCTLDARVFDAGEFHFYAGPVSLEAQDTCIHVKGTLTYDGQTVSAETTPAASHCD